MKLLFVGVLGVGRSGARRFAVRISEERRMFRHESGVVDGKAACLADFLMENLRFPKLPIFSCPPSFAFPRTAGGAAKCTNLVDAAFEAMLKPR